jgi:hypothetical protein
LGIRKLVLESDSTDLVIDFISRNQSKVDANYALIDKAKRLLDRD